jgi:uncharacterized protein DUF5916/cellulose/xylan binding protein with CBM9 domain
MVSKYLVIILFCVSNLQLVANPSNELQLNTFKNGIKLDGYLNEDVWKTATRITDFYTIQPVAGKPAEERTAVLLGYDEKNLYLAFICFYDDPSVIRASISQRDDIFEDDFILLYLDTFDAGETAYQFAFNPYGIQGDGIYTEHVGESFKQDFLFDSQGRIFSKGYIVEAQIPFSSINFPNKKKMDWRFAILRHTEHLNHDTVWPKVTLNSTDWVGQFGKLNGINSIQTGKGLEILPEFSAIRIDDFSVTDSKVHSGPIKGDPGLNLKYGISSGLNLDLTYNPDFSQVEADADKIDINRRSPLYFSEKRPFFLEGTDIFKTPIQAVYTRQMVDPLAGIKLSGRVGEYSIGLLSTVDEYQGTRAFFEKKAEENGLAYWMPEYTKLVDTTLAQKYGSKKSINNVLRIKRNIFSNSSIGLLATDREFEGSFNRVYGLDGRFAFSDNDVLTAQGLYSQSKDLVSSKFMEGPAFYGNYWHGTNTWNVQLFYNDYAPEFRVDNGFIERADIIANGFREGGVQLWYDFKWHANTLQYLRPILYTTRIIDHENNLIEDNVSGSLFLQFDFKTEITASYFYSREIYAGLGFDKYDYSINLINTSFSWLKADLYYFAGDEISYFTAPSFLGYVNFASLSFIFKPVSNVNVNLTQRYYRFTGGVNGINEAVTQDIKRIRLTWQLTRYLELRYIAERTILNYDDPYYNFANSGNIDLSLLFSYTPSPGTVIFLGYNDFYERGTNFQKGWPTFNRFTQSQRGLFMKLSYLFKAHF